VECPARLGELAPREAQRLPAALDAKAETNRDLPRWYHITITYAALGRPRGR